MDSFICLLCSSFVLTFYLFIFIRFYLLLSILFSAIYFYLLFFTSIHFYLLLFNFLRVHTFSFFFSFWFRVSWPRRLVSTYEPGSETDSCIELTNIETSTDVIEEQDYRAWNDDCDYDSQKAHGYE